MAIPTDILRIQTPLDPEPSIQPFKKPDAILIHNKEAAQNAQSAISNFIQSSEDPFQEAKKIEGTKLLSDLTGWESEFVYNNWDAIIETWTGRKNVKPETGFDAIKNSWKTAEATSSRGHFGYGLLDQEITEETYKTIEEFQATMPSQDEIKRSWPVEFIKSAAGILPQILESIEAGAQKGLLAGGGTALTAALLGQAGPQVGLPEEIVTVPASFLFGFTAGTKIGAAQNILEIEAGNQFMDMLLMEDEDGDRIDPTLAKAGAIAYGSISTAIELLQISQIPGMEKVINKAFGQAVTASAPAIKNILLTAARTLKKSAGNVLGQVAEEATQEAVGILTQNLVALVENEFDAGTFQYTTVSEAMEQIGTVALESAKGFAVIGLPGTVLTAASDISTRRELVAGSPEETKNVQTVATQQDVPEAATTILEENQIQATDDAAKAEQNESYQSVTSEGLMSVLDSNNKKAAEVSIEETEDGVVITDITMLPGADPVLVGQQIITGIQQQLKQDTVIIDPQSDAAELIKRTIEDQDPAVRRLNERLDTLKDEFTLTTEEIERIERKYGTEQEIQENIAAIQEALKVAPENEELSARMQTEVDKLEEIQGLFEVNSNIEEVIDSAEARKGNYNVYDFRQPYQLTKEEYTTKYGKIEQERFETSIDGQTFKVSAARSFPSLTTDEIDAATALISARADAEGKSFSQYVADTFKQSIFSTEKLPPGKAAATVFFEDSRALIVGSKQADITSMVHEIGHVFRKQLSTESRETAELYYKVENGKWTTTQEEKFAIDFERYLADGEAPTSKLKAVFQKFKEWIERVYAAIGGVNSYVSPELGKVFDSLFKERAEAQGESVSQVLFQDHRELVKDALGRGKPVPDNVLIEYAGEDWADTEIEKRRQDKIKDDELSWLAIEAEQFDDPKAFSEFVQTDFFLFTETEERKAALKNIIPAGQEDQWYEDFYLQANVTDIQSGNKEWLKRWGNKEAITNIVQALEFERDEGREAKTFPFHGSFYGAVAKSRVGKEIKDSQFKTMRAVLEKNTTIYRQRVAELFNDDVEQKRLTKEIEYSAAIKVEDNTIKPPKKSRIQLASEIENIRRQEALIQGEESLEDVDGLLKETRNKLRADEKKIKSLESNLSEEKRESFTKFGQQQQVFKKLNTEITEQKRLIARLEKKIVTREERLKTQKTAAREKSGIKLRELRAQHKRKLQAVKALERAVARKGKFEAVQASVLKERRKWQERNQLRIDLQTQRDLMMKLAKSIIRPVEKNVHADYREMIESIQAGIDPKMRSKSTVRQWKQRAEFFKKHQERLRYISKKTLKAIYKKPLNLFTTEELEEISAEVEHLRKLGKLRYELEQAQLQAKIDNEVEVIVKTLESQKDFEAPSDIIISKRTTDPVQSAKRKARGVYAQTLRIARVSDWIDGGKGEFTGMTHEVFINQTNEGFEKAARGKFDRYKQMDQEIKRLNIDIKELGSKEHFTWLKKNEFITLGQMIKIYANTQNDKNWDAQIYGNQIDQLMSNEVIKRIREKYGNNYIEFAEIIMDDYDAFFNPLDDANVKIANQRLVREPRYTPMSRIRHSYMETNETLADEFFRVYGKGREKVYDNFVNSRIDISPEGQQAIEIADLYGEWYAQVAKQMHYIEMASQVQEMRKILGNDKLRAMIRQKKGNALLTEMEKYTDRVANPDSIWSNDDISKAIRGFKKNFAIAVLSMNALVILKQAPSILFYTAESSPANFMSALMKVPARWKYYTELVYSKDFLMKERSIDRVLDAIKRSTDAGIKKTIRKIGASGMKGIAAMDHLVTVTGWVAVYETALGKGMSEREAVNAARNATLRTQPAASAKDLPRLYSTEAVTLFTMFTNQLNQIWNMATYDAPRRIANGQVGKGLMTYTAIAASGLMIWILTNKRLPREPEDITDAVADTLLNFLPIFGPVVANYRDGWNQETAIFAPAKSGYDAYKNMRKAIEEGDIDKFEKAALAALEAVSYIEGIPFVFTKRVYKGFKDGAFIEHVLFGREWGE